MAKNKNKSKKGNTTQKVLAIAGVVGLGLVAYSGGYMVGFSQGHDSVVIPECPVSEPQIEYKTETVVEEVIVEKEVPVEVKDEYLTQALIDREIVDDEFDPSAVFMAEDLALSQAISLIEEDFADELEDADLVADEDDAELVKIYSDWEDVEVIKSDYEDEEYTFKVKAKFKDDEEDLKFKAFFTVEIEDSEIKIVDVEKEE